MKTTLQWIVLGACCVIMAILALSNTSRGKRHAAPDVLSLAQCNRIKAGMDFTQVNALFKDTGKSTRVDNASVGAPYEGLWGQAPRNNHGFLSLNVTFGPSGAIAWTGTVVDEASGQSTNITRTLAP